MKAVFKDYVQNTVSIIESSLVALLTFLRGFPLGSARELQRRPAVHHCALSLHALPSVAAALPTAAPRVSALCDTRELTDSSILWNCVAFGPEPSQESTSGSSLYLDVTLLLRSFTRWYPSLFCLVSLPWFI